MFDVYDSLCKVNSCVSCVTALIFIHKYSTDRSEDRGGLIRPNAPPPVANRNQVMVPVNNGQNLAPPAVRNMAPQGEPAEFDDLAEFIAYRDAENYVEPETDIIPFENYARQNVESPRNLF